MESEHLVRMANQITSFFEVYPKNEALDGIAKHIHNSWDPRMRDAMVEIVRSGGKGLNPLFVEAMELYVKGPNTPGPKASVNPRVQAPRGANPSFADQGGDAG